MKTMRKKLISLLLCAVMALGMLLPAFADDIPAENGYIYEVRDTEDGPMLYIYWYEGEEEEAFVPKTLAGIAVTPKNFTGSVFCNGSPVRSIRVEEDNPYFKTVDGALYTTDGKTLVFYPQTEDETYLLTIPDGVLLAAVERNGETFIPNGSTNIREGDKVLILSLLSAAGALESLLHKSRSTSL